MNNVLNHGVKAGDDGNQDFELTPLVVDANGFLLTKSSGSAGQLTLSDDPANVMAGVSVSANSTLANIFGNSTAKSFSVQNTHSANAITVVVQGKALVTIPAGGLYETPPNTTFLSDVSLRNDSGSAIVCFVASW